MSGTVRIPFRGDQLHAAPDHPDWVIVELTDVEATALASKLQAILAGLEQSHVVVCGHG